MRIPEIAGAKLMLIWQLKPGCMGLVQLSVSRNWVEAEIPPMFKGPAPVFVKVTAWELLLVPMCCWPKVRDAGWSETAPAPSPRPCNGSTCGEALSEALIVILPFLIPVAAGWKMI